MMLEEWPFLLFKFAAALGGGAFRSAFREKYMFLMTISNLRLHRNSSDGHPLSVGICQKQHLEQHQEHRNKP